MEWVYEYFGNVFMLDDDVVGMKRNYFQIAEKVNNKQTVREFIETTALAAREAGAYLFGFSKNSNPTTYRSIKPIELTGYIASCATGLLSDSKLFYDPSIKANVDYWIRGLNVYFYRVIYKGNRFTFIQKNTFVDPDGLSEFRNMQSEKYDLK